MMRKLSLILLVIFLLFSGFIRDFVMMNINHVVKHLTTGAPNFSVPWFYGLAEWPLRHLMLLKWGLTVVFFLYFWWLSRLVLRQYFTSDKDRVGKSISVVYLALFTVSGLLYGVGFVLGVDKTIYPIVRTLMGLSHSFIPVMVVFLYQKYFPVK